MPQASDELRDQFEDDSAAMTVLQEHFSLSATGVIRPRTADRQATDREKAAIDYLVLEWDYAWEPRPRITKAEGKPQ